MDYQVKLISKNRPGTELHAVGVVLHETATPGATAENEYQYFNRSHVKASAHAFVDDRAAIQTIPYDETAWHAGQTANSRYIGIEMCRPAYYDPVYFKKVYQNTVELIADLFLNFIGVLLITENNLMSHAEVSVKWKETDHTDPNAYFMEYGKSMDIFRRDVQDRIDEERGTMGRVEEMEKRLSALENKMIYN